MMGRDKITIFALVGFGEGMEKDIARVKRIAELGAYPFVMRYVPLDSLKKRPPAKGWDTAQITQFSRYYNMPKIWTTGVDLERWLRGIRPGNVPKEQIALEVD